MKSPDFLGHMSLEIFQLALTHGKPKQEGHTSLSELLTRALLYSEAGQALLNIIATGVDAIDLFLTLQTRSGIDFDWIHWFLLMSLILVCLSV